MTTKSRASAQDGSYDLDCAVMLCMAGSWPAVTECDGAYAYMLDRITDLPPQSPFGVCSMADGSGYDAFALDYAVGSRQARNAYSCPTGSSLYFSQAGGGVTAFCFETRTEVIRTDEQCYKTYQGITEATYRQLVADLTLEPGTDSAWDSPRTIVETPVSALGSFEELCTTTDVNVEVTANDGVTVPPLSSFCLTPLIAPSNSEICNGRWGIAEAVGGNSAHAPRASCARTSEGETVLAMTAHKGEPNSLNQLLVSAPAARSYDSVRASVEFMIPEDYKVFDGGRLAFGVLIGEASCSSGGCAPEDQKGAMIRAQFKEAENGSITLQNYSYHLDRGTKSQTVDSVWEGNGTQEVTWGAGKDMSQPIPKGEWITLTYDVTLNDPGQANGRSVLSAYDSAGKIIGVAAFTGVTYRPDSTWKISGLAMTEKYTHPLTQMPTQTQSIFYRNFKLQGGDTAAPGCSG